MVRPTPKTQLDYGPEDCRLGQLPIAGCAALCSNGAMAHGAKPAIPEKQAALLRRVPSVDEILLRPQIAALAGTIERAYLVETVRSVLAKVRCELISAHSADEHLLEPSALEQKIREAVEAELEPSLRPVINASGVILHTNLGRAPLSELVVEEFRRSATHYSNLEYDLSAGARGRRDSHTARLLQTLTGAEDAIVVNNCAAGLLVTLAALARGGEVIVSRGELIEIGDGFRIPDIMEQSGAILREVGTTNRTRVADFENALNEKTRMLLKVHPSNFQVTGFTEKPEVAELISLGQRAGLPVVEDLGSGCLVDLVECGISEPTTRESVAAGFSLVLFSADKLLGGPQAGIIAGQKDLVAKVRRHPLFRALRVDKLTIAALEVTLRAYLQAVWTEIPVQSMIRQTLGQLANRAEQFVEALRGLVSARGTQFEVVDGASLLGGGSTPAQSLPTKLVRIASARHSATQLETRLRNGPTGIPVIARIEADRLLIDLRTVFPEQEATLTQALVAALH
jgi:L-seryl-tRNA(Ser) seleniumtransferase